MTLSGYLYDAGGHDREVAVGEALPPLADRQLLWLDCDARDAGSLAALARLLRLPPALAGQLGTDGPDTLETHGRFFRLRVATAPVLPDADPAPSGRQTRRAMRAGLAKLLRGSAWDLGTARLDLLVGPNWLASVRDGDVPYLAAFREQDKAETLIGVLSPALLAASLLDWHLESYFAALGRVQALVDRLDEGALVASRSDRRQLAALAFARRRVSLLRARLDPQRRVFYGLGRPDFALVAGADGGDYYRVLATRFDRLLDAVEKTCDLTGGSFELLAAKTNQDTNELVKVLTFITVVEGVFGAVSGLFGMNFETPILQAGLTGFLAVTGGLILFAVAAFFVARRRHWF